mgnify:CR=1 FL=1
MEDGLRLLESSMRAFLDVVLILVVMEDGLRPYCQLLWGGISKGLNPCCNGRWSQTGRQLIIRIIQSVLILVVMEDGLRHMSFFNRKVQPIQS